MVLSLGWPVVTIRLRVRMFAIHLGYHVACQGGFRPYLPVGTAGSHYEGGQLRHGINDFDRGRNTLQLYMVSSREGFVSSAISHEIRGE
jgi:hypothetical protein